jgi:hypothetical protein
MNVLGLDLPKEFILGLCVGGSASFMILAELPPDSKLARAIMKTRTRRIVWSSIITCGIGYFTNPLTGIIAELLVYPAFCIKSRSVKKQLDKICDDMNPGESKILTFKGESHMITKVPRQTLTQPA